MKITLYSSRSLTMHREAAGRERCGIKFCTMKIKIPSEEEHKKNQKRKRISGLSGLLFGFTFFGLAGIRIFRYGFDEVETYTWVALGFGVLSFGWLAFNYGEAFWNTLFRY